MFTGLVEEIGSVISIAKDGESIKIKIKADKVLNGANVGDSIATNGVCLTAVEIGGDFFTADAMPETTGRTNLRDLKKGDKVNLEKSITLSTPLGGHLVTGDVDGEGEISAVTNEGIAVVYEITAPDNVMKYIVEKGRIAVDGASLTVVSFREKSFKIAIIPHSQEHLTLSLKKKGDKVNLEADLIGKYVEKFLAGYIGAGKPAKKEIDMKFLLENGFA